MPMHYILYTLHTLDVLFPVKSNKAAIFNPCLSNPCLQGACQEAPGATVAFQCVCPETHTGVLCGTKIPDCDVNPCKNAGSCEDTHGKAVCTCTENFSGRMCEYDLRNCNDRRKQYGCAEGAQCKKNMTTGQFYCKCRAWQGGPRCEGPPENGTDHCATRVKYRSVEQQQLLASDGGQMDQHGPCWYGGLCHRLKNTYQCDCPRGTQGKDCSIGCPIGWYGVRCLLQCHNCRRDNCHYKTGDCIKGCSPGFVPPACRTKDGRELHVSITFAGNPSPAMLQTFSPHFQEFSMILKKWITKKVCVKYVQQPCSFLDLTMSMGSLKTYFKVLFSNAEHNKRNLSSRLAKGLKKKAKVFPSGSGFTVMKSSIFVGAVYPVSEVSQDSDEVSWLLILLSVFLSSIGLTLISMIAMIIIGCRRRRMLEARNRRRLLIANGSILPKEVKASSSSGSKSQVSIVLRKSRN